MKPLAFLAIIALGSAATGHASEDGDFSFAAATATTKPGGTLKATEVWTAAGGPYLVTGTVTVPAGGTLTIEPGTSVYLASGVNLVVSNGGRLLAEGTQVQRIRFSSPPGTSTSWGGITINGGAASPGTRMAYVYLEGNAKTCITLAAGTLVLDHVTFNTTTHSYLSLDGGSFVVSHCTFPATTASFEVVHGTGGIKAGGHGIIRDCFFGGTVGYSDAIDFTGGNRDQNQPILQVVNNVFMGSTDDILDLDGTDAWIEGNLFLHCHRGSGTPDSAAAVSGGNSGSRTSEVTLLGNLFFDCDNAATAKQGNFFTFLNNTIIRTTKQGGMDTDSGVVAVRDTTPSLTTFAAGFYLEGNVIWDAEQLVRSYDPNQTTVTFVNNILPMPWTGPGGGNVVVDPQLKHVPQVSETQFTDWQQAQVLWDWFSLKAGSAGHATGLSGLDKGGVIPLGLSISGEPDAITCQNSATLVVGPNRTGSGIPKAGFPLGSGFTHYRWRLDRNAWSAETPIATAIKLTGLSPGSHHVEVTGKNDAGTYQDDPLLGTDAAVTMSRVWTVDPAFGHLQLNEVLARDVSTAAGGSGHPATIELTYEGPAGLDLAGMKIGHDPNDPVCFTFPAGTRINPGQYLVLLADKAAGPGLHLGFSLSEDGDGVFLYDRSARLIDSVVFGPQLADLSLGRMGYEDSWRLTVPTLGKANVLQPCGNPAGLKINEWLARPKVRLTEGFVELYNPQPNPLDLGGMCLTHDAVLQPPLYRISPLTFMPGGGYEVVWTGSSSGLWHWNSPLPQAGGTVSLWDSDANLVDGVVYGTQTDDVSQGRLPDGGATRGFIAAPTPGAANPAARKTTQTTISLVAEAANKRVLVPSTAVSDDWRGGKAFDDSKWTLCSGGPGGVGYDTASDYLPLITLDVKSLMYGSGKNASCCLRIPFTLEADTPADVNHLSLKVRCDDGYVAYLNGQEVARINFTGTPAWNSHADSSASDDSSLRSVDITAYRGQLKAGANTLAIQAMNNSSTSSDFLISAMIEAVLVRLEVSP